MVLGEDKSKLFPFRHKKDSEYEQVKLKRPRNIQQINDYKICERWREDCMLDIAQNMHRVQDPGISDYQIRTLNDRINLLLKEKRQWEFQIKHLGGADYTKMGYMLSDDDGNDIKGLKGYRYFGRAKLLPGVKELFENNS